VIASGDVLEGQSPLELFLKDASREINKHSRASTKSIIATGDVLIRVKENVKHGTFKSWVAHQCGFTMRSAQNYIRASALAASAGEIISLLNPAAIYRLAATRTPPEVVSYVVGMLQRGNVPNEGEIAAMIMLSNRHCQRSSIDRTRADQQLALHLASELYSRLDSNTAHKLISAPWSATRNCLRTLIRQSQDQHSDSRSQTADTRSICAERLAITHSSFSTTNPCGDLS
jgi:hypothetical protein